MTENCGVSHATLPGKQRPGTVGLPYDGVQSRLDPANGEIQIKSAVPMLGYYKEPELTRQAHDRRRLAAHRRQGQRSTPRATSRSPAA
jgi:long-subunit acyl-CoA synthetase (AMP-forming)